MRGSELCSKNPGSWPPELHIELGLWHERERALVERESTYGWFSRVESAIFGFSDSYYMLIKHTIYQHDPQFFRSH